jgi:hypothetical protein
VTEQVPLPDRVPSSVGAAARNLSEESALGAFALESDRDAARSNKRLHRSAARAATRPRVRRIALEAA